MRDAVVVGVLVEKLAETSVAVTLLVLATRIGVLVAQLAQAVVAGAPVVQSIKAIVVGVVVLKLEETKMVIALRLVAAEVGAVAGGRDLVVMQIPTLEVPAGAVPRRVLVVVAGDVILSAELKYMFLEIFCHILARASNKYLMFPGFWSYLPNWNVLIPCCSYSGRIYHKIALAENCRIYGLNRPAFAESKEDLG